MKMKPIRASSSLQVQTLRNHNSVIQQAELMLKKWPKAMLVHANTWNPNDAFELSHSCSKSWVKVLDLF